MANEFIIRKGYIALDDSQITGSLSVTNAVSASIFSGSFVGDGSQLSGVSAGFPYTGSAVISGSLQVTGSISTDTDAIINSLTVGKGGGNLNTNTAVGYNALSSNTDGNFNVAMGYNALASSVQVDDNVAIGYNALSSSIADMGPNTAVGRGALQNNVYGFRNTAVGNSSLFSNTQGMFNTAVGNTALLNNTEGNENIAIGDGTLNDNTVGDYNTGVGTFALFNNTAGDNNTGIGHSALYNNLTGSNNIAIGTDAGLFAGSGFTSLDSVNNSIFVGYRARALNATGDTNEIVIGHNTVGSGSNTTVIGNNSTISTTLRGAVSASIFSGSFVGDGSQLTGIADPTPITATINNTNSPFTITSQSIVIIDSTNGDVTVNLPDLDAIVGTSDQKPILLYKNDYSQNVIYVQPSGSQLVNGTTQDLIVSLQIGIVYNPTSAGWVTEGTSYQSLAELELFFVPRTETGSLSVATASYVEYSDVANKPALVSGSEQITYSGLTGIPSGIISGSSQISDFGIFATTGSNGFNGDQSITGSLTVTGQVVAQTLNVQQVTSSIVYSSGSNIFGNNLSNTQQFTGSVGVTGSLTVAGAGTFSNSIYGTNALFGSAFLSNETSKIGIGFESGYGLVNSWGANTSTFGGLKFQINASNGNTFNALTIAPSGFVGIGTNASLPYGRFEVADVSQLTNAGQWASATISMKQVSGVIGNYSQIVFGYHSNTQTNGSAYIGYVATNQGSNGYGDLVFGTRAVNTDTQPTERMRITSGGSVGIGIDNPSTFLHVFGSNTANRGQLSIQSNNASNGARATWYYDTTLQGEIGTTSGDFYALAVNNFLFYTGGNPRMTITSGGNVGIGTTSPNLSAGAAGSTILTISATTSGRNGVLELNGTRTNSTDISGYVRFFNNGAATPLADIRGIRGSSDTVGDLAFETSNSERMRITSGGSVGINNTSPMNSAWGNDTNTKQLSIDGSSYAVINLQGSTRKYSMGVGDNNFYMCYDNTANRHNIVVSSGGNVLLGTSTDSGSKLRVIGNLQIDNGFQKMYTYYIIVQPNTTGTITISSPTGSNIQGSMQVMAGGYGNSLSGNVTGLWMVGGLLFFNNASTSTITQIVNSVTANGSMSFQRSGDQYTVTLTNTSSTQTKTFYVSVIINGD